MKHGLSVWVASGAIAMQLLIAGCGGGGGGLGGFFEGLFGGGDSGSAFDIGGGGASEPLTLASEVATVHHPEPASMALFGGGLAALAHWRRRQAKAKRSRR